MAPEDLAHQGDMFEPAVLAAGPTDWLSMSIGEVLAIIASMNDANVTGDANTLLKAIGDVQRAAAAMTSVFGSDLLDGLAADASVRRGRRIASDLTAGSQDVTQAAAAMTAAAGILSATRAQAHRLEMLRADLRDNPENAAATRAEVSRTMTTTYASPIISVHEGLPRPPGPMDDIAGAGSAPTGTAPTASTPGHRETSGNTTDTGDLRPRRTTPGPRPGGPAPAPTPPPAPTPTVPPETTTPAAPAGRGESGGDDPDDRLRRDGTGLPRDPGVAVGRADRPARPDGAGDTTAGDGTNPANPSAPLLGAPLPGMLPTSPLSASPLSGSPLSGAPAAGPPGTAGPTSGSPGAARPGTAPMSPAMGPGGRRTDARDETYTPAAYLHSEENGREIVGQLPLVGPPVLGDWIPDAVPPTPEPVPEPAMQVREVTYDGTEPDPAETTEPAVPRREAPPAAT